MKKYHGSVDSVIGLFLFVSVFFVYPCCLMWKKAKTIKKEEYNSLEVLKYSGDTIEFVFHNSGVKGNFNREWKAHNRGQNITNQPVSDNMRVLKYSGDTVQLKFEDARFQRQFEKQWRKYSDYKLNHINQNIKKR